MSWRMTESVEEFLAEAGDLLRAERSRNTIMLTVTEMLGTQPVAFAAMMGAPMPVFGWWQDPGAAGGFGGGAAFLQTPPLPALLTAMAQEAAGALARDLVSAGRAIPGVNGPDDTAWAFAAAWRDLTGLAASVRSRQRLFRLGELSWPSPMPAGEARLATAADRDLLIAWFGAFAAEAGAMGALDHEVAVDVRLGYHGLTIWEAGGSPVSLAGVTKSVAGMVRVGPVYTPRELRGRGYAGAATAAVSQAVRDAGTAEVLLYTDLANPTSNALYQRLGYRPVEDRVILEFG
jgi:GNAT superfamily N-acetyltransferase